MLTRLTSVALILALSGWTAFPGTASEKGRGGHNGREVYSKAIKGTVMVGGGSGFLVDREKRLVVTNAHVVGWLTEAGVKFPAYKDGKLITERSYYQSMPSIPAKVLHVDTSRDLAVLELASVPLDVVALKLATKEAKPGEDLHLIGNTGASDGTWLYTSGTVRQVYKKRYKYPDETEFFDGWVIESQLPTNYGDSGGPVVNRRGEVVGVHRGGNPNGGYDIRIHIDVRELRTALADAAARPNVPRPTTAKQYAELGRQYHYWLGKLNQALVAFDQSIKLNPKAGEVYAERAMVHYALKDRAKTIADCDEALRLNPKLFNAFKFRGMARADRGETKLAIDDYTQALALNSDDGWTLLYRSWMYENLGDHDRAAADRLRAKELGVV